jgi:hypothetical protein
MLFYSGISAVCMYRLDTVFAYRRRTHSGGMVCNYGPSAASAGPCACIRHACLSYPPPVSAKQLMGALQLGQVKSSQRQVDAEKVQPWFLRDSPGFQIVPELGPLRLTGLYKPSSSSTTQS